MHKYVVICRVEFSSGKTLFFVSFVGSHSYSPTRDRPCACTHFLLKLRLGLNQHVVWFVSFVHEIFAGSRLRNINDNYPGEGTTGGIHEVRMAFSFPNLYIYKYTILPLYFMRVGKYSPYNKMLTGPGVFLVTIYEL